jgi:hypothetical protein
MRAREAEAVGPREDVTPQSLGLGDAESNGPAAR